MERDLTANKDIILVIEPDRDQHGMLHEHINKQSFDHPVQIASSASDADPRLTYKALLDLGAEELQSYPPLPAIPARILMRPFRLGALLDTLIELDQLTLSEIKIGPYRLSPITKELTSAQTAHPPIILTDKEYDILYLLGSHKGQSFSRTEMLEVLWGFKADIEIDTHTLETHIYRLRQKIEDSGAKEPLIQTIQTGYCIAL